jgi:lipopolysaccharide export system permease protein
MRKTLFKYVAGEMLLYFAVCFLFFFLIFFVNQMLLMAEDILSKKAPVGDVVMLIVYALPSIIATSAPFAALVGTLMGLGRLVSDREVLSMNALGVPLRFVLVPVLAVGIFVSILSFFTNDILLPAGTIQFNRLYRKILTSTPALELESNSIKRNQNAIVVSGTISDGRMDQLLVIDSDDDGNRRVIASPGAVIEKSSNPGIIMTLHMNNASVAVLDKNVMDKFDVIQSKDIAYNILTKNIMPLYSNRVTPREMSSRDLFRELLIREKNRKNDGGPQDKNLNLYRMEFHKKFSIPFGAFFFVILAFPLGLMAKTNGQSVGFILGLIVAVLYWAMLVGGQTLSLRLGLDGALMMWLPNAIVFAFGLIFLGRKLFQ